MPKPVPPTLRERNRYMVFELVCDFNPDRKQVVKAVWDSMLGLYGAAGAAEASLWFMDWVPEKSRGIVKVNHRSVEVVRPVLALIKEVGGRPCVVRVLSVSGTLRKARESL
jgi:ribonuclease P/MRP protein subunit POP5